MPEDLLDTAIEAATKTERAAELHRQSRRFEQLRDSPAWAELREIVKGSRVRVVEDLGKKLLAGADAAQLRDAGNYSRGFLDGCEMLLDKPDDVHKRLTALIDENLERLRRESVEQAASPYT